MEVENNFNKNIDRTYFNFDKDLKNSFKAATALKGKRMVEVFKEYMECFIKHPEKCLQFVESLLTGG